MISSNRLANPAIARYNTLRSRATSSAEERFLHTEEVTGSIPVSPTKEKRVAGPWACHFFCFAVLSLGKTYPL